MLPGAGGRVNRPAARNRTLQGYLCISCLFTLEYPYPPPPLPCRIMGLGGDFSFGL